MFTIGCGKKANEKKDRPDRHVNPQLPDHEIELDKQELFCGSDRSCPDYLTKIAFNNKGTLKFCTGFLMEKDMVVTSSSCLPEIMRMKGAACDKYAFFFFAEPGQKPTRVGCDSVIEVSQLDGKEPFLWRSDVAYLKLSKPINRRTVSYPSNRSGMNNLDLFYTWTVDQIDEHQGIIRKTENCQPVHGSFFNPISNNQSSPVMTMAGCEFNPGNSGAPILDYRGKVRGIISRPVSKADIDEVDSMRILERPLKPLIHVSNYACLPVVPSMDVLNENECNKRLDISTHDIGQRDMISDSNVFRPAIQKIEHELNLSSKNRYLKMVTNLSPVDEAFDVQITPKCFKNVSEWLGEFYNNKPFTYYMDIPVIRIKKAMSEHGIIFAHVSQIDSERTSIQFRPSFLRNSNPRQATVFMWTFNSPTRTFPSVSENCN